MVEGDICGEEEKEEEGEREGINLLTEYGRS
jgi:hypothetical protein